MQPYFSENTRKETHVSYAQDCLKCAEEKICKLPG